MSSYAAKTALICAIALIWLSPRDQVRASVLDAPFEIVYSVGDEGNYSHEAQLVWYVQPSLCLALEPAPAFADVARTAARDVDAMVGVAILKRGPPTLDAERI